MKAEENIWRKIVYLVYVLSKRYILNHLSKQLLLSVLFTL